MLFDKTHLFLVHPKAIERVLGSNDENVLNAVQDLLEKSALPADVQDHVCGTVSAWLEASPKQEHLDLIGTLALITLIGSIAEPVEMESLDDLTNIHGIIQDLTDRMEYNAMTHLFGNPPSPFSTVETTGTTLDIGHLNTFEIEDFYDELVSMEFSDDGLDEFSDEFGVNLLEDLVDPFQEILETAMDQDQELIFITAH